MDDQDEVNTPNINGGNNSIAVGGINIRGDVSGTITIGNSGYTSEEVSVLITEIKSTFQPKPFDGRCPYKGLDVFEEEDAELFFGREKLVDDLVIRVKDARTVFVTGPSGSGKSSLVRAGLIHALKQGAIKNSDRWLYATMKPGRDPIGDLGRVASSLAGSTNAEDEIRSKAIEDETIFARWCEIALKEGRDKRAVLFIDQFEEVFTQIGNEAERVAFLNLLTHSATIENGRVIILFSMRSDFVSNCATYPQLNALLNQQFVQIGAMQPEELVSAIAQPALRVGLQIDPDLIAQIINDMKGEPGALPLMQFALKDLFDAGQDKGGVIALTLNEYIQRGGIQKSLARHADSAFAKLSESERELARSIFSGLIEIGRGTQDTRRTALFDELVPTNAKAEDVESIVQKLADARLITTDEQAGKDTVTISHEKLIDAWPWLKKLVNENRDVIALQNEISANAKEWDEHNRDNSYLYRGARLATAQEKNKTLVLNENSQAYLIAGMTFRDKEQRERERRLRWTVTASIVAAIIFFVLASFGLVKSNEATARANDASTAQANAETQVQIALARQLAAQAQSVFSTGYTRQTTAVLLAVRSMQIFPSIEAEQVLQNNTLARPIAVMTYGDIVTSVAFSPDGKYVVSGGCDKRENGLCIQSTARVWEAATGKEISHMVHDSEVSVAFSPDGMYVVSADKTIRVWQASTGKEVAHMTYVGYVTSVVFSPNGKHVAAGSDDGTIRVWETITGKEVASMTDGNRIVSVAFSPFDNGKYLVSGNNAGEVRVWETMTGREVTHMSHDLTVWSVAFSPDGNYVVSGSEDRTARVWETSTGTEVSRMTHDAGVMSVVFSPDGRYVISGSLDKTALVWEVTTGKEIARMTHNSGVSSVAFSPDGNYVVSGSYDNTARVWEAATGKEIARMTHDDSVNAVAFSPDGRFVISGSYDDTARVWEVSAGEEIIRLPHNDSWVNSVAFSRDGKYLVSGSDDYTARVWEVATNKEIARMTHDGEVTSVAIDPGRKYVVSAGCDKKDSDSNCIQSTVRVWEAITGKLIASMIHDGEVASVVFSPDGKYLLSGSSDKTARVWEATTGKEIARMTHDNWVDSVAFSPDGKYVVSGSEDGSARVWEAATGKEVANISRDDYVSSVTFSPNGKLVAVGGCVKDKNNGCIQGTARVWEAATGKEVAHMTQNSDVFSVAFSPDGKYVVSGSADNTARVWEATTGKEVARMTHEDAVISVAFSPDGKYVVSGGNDFTVRVWESATGKELARMTTDSDVLTVAFSPDGRYVLSGSLVNIAHIWQWQPDDLIATACVHLSRNLTRVEWEQYIGDVLPYHAVCPNLPIEPEVISTPAATP